MKICVLAIFESTTGQLPGVDEISRTVAEALLKPAHGGVWIWHGDAGVPPAPPGTAQRWRLLQNMNCREGPGTMYPIIVTLMAGEVVEQVKPPDGNWLPTERGYISQTAGGQPTMEKIT